MAIPALSRARASLLSPLRSLSTAGGEDRSAPYRRLLGIGDSLILVGYPGSGPKPWRPPIKGELKLNFSISLSSVSQTATITRYGNNGFSMGIKAGPLVGGIGGFEVLARNSSGDMLGLVRGSKECDTKYGLQLYALKAAGNLTKILKDRGYHNGPVVYEAAEYCLTAACLCEKGEGFAELSPVEQFMPQDLEDVGKYCKTHIGPPEELLKAIDSRYPGLKERIQQDKKSAGLGATRNEAHTACGSEGGSRGSGAK